MVYVIRSGRPGTSRRKPFRLDIIKQRSSHKGVFDMLRVIVNFIVIFTIRITKRINFVVREKKHS